MATTKKKAVKKVTKKAPKKKVAKRAAKKAVQKKATKKAAKKKLSKKVAKKATKKLTPEQETEKLAAKINKEMELKLEKEFAAAEKVGTLTVGLTKDGLITKKDSDDEEVNDILNRILRAFESSLMAEQLAPVFQQVIVKNGQLAH